MKRTLLALFFVSCFVSHSFASYPTRFLLSVFADGMDEPNEGEFLAWDNETDRWVYKKDTTTGESIITHNIGDNYEIIGISVSWDEEGLRDEDTDINEIASQNEVTLSSGSLVTTDGTSTINFTDATDSVTFSTNIDLSGVNEIKLSDEMIEQLSNFIKQETRKEFHKMELNVSLSWGTWFMIFVLAVIAAKIAHKITLRTVFKPTKRVAAATEKLSKETAQHIKKEWDES